MRKNKNMIYTHKFRKKLINIMLIVIAVFVAVLICFGIYIIDMSASPESVWIPVAGAAAVFVIMFIFFIRHVYVPIKKIEKVLRLVIENDELYDAEVDNGIEIDEDNELYDMSLYINRLLQKFKGYAEREFTALLLVKQAELNALQTQINPHFLYNTLDSIRGVALKEGQKNIANMTKALSGLFRYSISKKDSLSTLREEIKHVQNYMTIQQLRFPGKFLFITDIDIKEDANILDYCVPKLTIQPIVENSVFHGLEKKLGPGKVSISAYITSKRMVLTIEDDGIGIEPEKLKKINDRLLDKKDDDKNHKASIGLSNVNERIKLFFGDEYGLKVISTQNIGTSVVMDVPLVK